MLLINFFRFQVGMTSKVGPVATRLYREKLGPEILEVFDKSFNSFTDVQVILKFIKIWP